MTRNEIFACAVDYLYNEGKITGQSDLAEKTGITETTISRILNNKVRKPSEDSLRRLNTTFGNIFNPRWLRGESNEMFADKKRKTIEKINEIDPKDLMAGVENLLQIAATQIKDNEELRRELQTSILENKELFDKMQTSIQELQDVVRSLLSRPYPEVQQEFMNVAEKSNELTKNKKSDKNPK